MRLDVPNAQRTLKEAVEISGRGLFSGRPASMRFLPAPANHGIVFVRTDLSERPEIPCTIEQIVEPDRSPTRSTVVQNGEAQVMMVEHLMATLFGLGIDNLIVEIDSVEMSAGNGSALIFTEPFLQAGLKELDAPRRRLEIDRPITVSDGDVLLMALPLEEALTVTYVLDYGRRFFGSQVLTLTVDQETFVKEIAPARTYCLRPEVDFFLKLGLGKGADEENTLIVEEDGSISGDLRFPDECVRHKILDLLGDLYLAGGMSTGRVLGYKSGHATNVRLARALYETCRG